MRATTLVPWASAIVAAIAGAIALRGADLGQEPWLISRASGLTAFALLSVTVIFGLLLSSRLARQWSIAGHSAHLHTFLSVLTLTFLAIHGGALLFDGFFKFSPIDLVVPFTGPYRPFWVGLGVISGWCAALVAASVRVRRRVGYAAWRRLHYLAFVAYVLSLVHGLTAGSDTSAPAVRALYIGSAAIIAALVTIRVTSRRPTRPTPPPPSGRRVRSAGQLALAAREVRHDQAA